MKKVWTALMAVMMTIGLASPSLALDDEHWEMADKSVKKGIEYLRSIQNEDGSWSPQPGPAITALVVRVMLDQPDIDANDPHVKKGLDYIMQFVQEDGGIYDGILPNYNTSISLMALARVPNRPDVAEAIKGAQKYLKGLQWNGQVGPDGKIVDENHPFYGGAGYGGSGRPDMSNTQFMLEALHESGVDCNDPVFQRAMVFITRCQGVAQNDMFADKIDQDGGFIYSTSINKDLVGVPESKANPQMMDEAKQGRPVSGLRTYGSITYAGFKSYIYANLDRDDPRVQAARSWISKNYTLDQNPGMPESIKDHGLFYYYMTFGRALSAWGATYVETAPTVVETYPKGTSFAAVTEKVSELQKQGHKGLTIKNNNDGTIEIVKAGEKMDWANDLIAKLVSQQKEDGSWANRVDRWMEGDPALVTAYSLLALQHAMD